MMYGVIILYHDNEHGNKLFTIPFSGQIQEEEHDGTYIYLLHSDMTKTSHIFHFLQRPGSVCKSRIKEFFM